MLKIWGTSDDLIEFDGDLYAENYAPDPDEFYIAVSNGMLIRGSFDGEWTFKVKDAGKGSHDYFSAGTEHAEEISDNDYSDVIVVHPHVTWAVVGEKAH